MKIIPYQPTSFGKITTQVGGDNPGGANALYVDKPELDIIMSGGEAFIPDPHDGAIGTLKIGQQEIPCLSREFRREWSKNILAKIPKMIKDEQKKWTADVARYKKLLASELKQAVKDRDRASIANIKAKQQEFERRLAAESNG
jgi:hypothetical protein